MQTFKEHMVEYLQGVLMDFGSHLHSEVEELHPGFKDRLKNYDDKVKLYDQTGDESLLVGLMREEFILSGMEEDATINRMKKTFERAKEARRNWMAEDSKPSTFDQPSTFN